MDNRSSSSSLSSSLRGSKELLLYSSNNNNNNNTINSTTTTPTVITTATRKINGHINSNNNNNNNNNNNKSTTNYETPRHSMPQWQHFRSNSSSSSSSCYNNNNNNISNSNSNSNNGSNNGNRIKLCGYLKKKRNKVGGWRKMWFVLQDKLLLSYASKEEYDTKLVSFKDVLNLVPGTLVRPLGGYRFTIETTTQTMYTFHCEDRNAYREWITMLLESLTNNNNNNNTCLPLAQQQQRQQLHQQQMPKKFIQRYGHYSMDNIPSALLAAVTPLPLALHNNNNNNDSNNSNNSNNSRNNSNNSGGVVGGGGVLPLRFCGFSSSFDSITQAQRATKSITAKTGLTKAPVGAGISGAIDGGSTSSGAAACCVRLPIVQKTAKLLERNGVNSCDLQQQQQQQQQQSTAHMICKWKNVNSNNNNNNNNNMNARDLQYSSVHYVQLPKATRTRATEFIAKPNGSCNNSNPNNNNNSNKNNTMSINNEPKVKHNQKAYAKCMMMLMQPTAAVANMQQAMCQKMQKHATKITATTTTTAATTTTPTIMHTAATTTTTTKTKTSTMPATTTKAANAAAATTTTTYFLADYTDDGYDNYDANAAVTVAADDVANYAASNDDDDGDDNDVVSDIGVVAVVGGTNDGCMNGNQTINDIPLHHYRHPNHQHEHEHHHHHHQQQQQQKRQHSIHATQQQSKDERHRLQLQQQQQQQQQQQRMHRRQSENSVPTTTTNTQCHRCNTENSSNAINGAQQLPTLKQQQQQQQQQQQHHQLKRPWQRQRLHCDCNCAYTTTTTKTTTTLTSLDCMADGAKGAAAASGADQVEKEMTLDECKALSMVRERIQRLNITDTLEYNCEDASSSGSSINPTHQHLKSSVTRTNGCVDQFLQQQLGTATDNMPNGNVSHVDSVLTPVEPIYAVVDLQHKYAQRKMRNANNRKADVLLLKRCNSYDSILHPCAAAAATTREFAHKQPYEREKSLSYTEDDIDGIYEDGDAFYQPLNGTDTITICNNNTTAAAANTAKEEPKTYCDHGLDRALGAGTADIEENIYEPINMPRVAAADGAGGNSYEAHAFWKYLTRLKVNSLLQLTRRMRHKGGGDYDTIKLPPTPTTATDVPDTNISVGSSRSSSISDAGHASRPPQSDVSNNAASSTSTSHFSTIKRKFGTHRKSMQVRMRKFCTRAYEPKPLFKQHHQNGGCPETAATSANATAANISIGHCSNGMKYTDNHHQKTSSKLKYRWKSVKIRAHNLHFPAGFAHGATTTSVAPTTATEAARRRSFFDSLPHMRRARLSLFSGAHQPPATKAKDNGVNTTAAKRLSDATLTDSEN